MSKVFHFEAGIAYQLYTASGLENLGPYTQCRGYYWELAKKHISRLKKPRLLNSLKKPMAIFLGHPVGGYSSNEGVHFGILLSPSVQFVNFLYCCRKHQSYQTGNGKVNIRMEAACRVLWKEIRKYLASISQYSSKVLLNALFHQEKVGQTLNKSYHKDKCQRKMWKI